LTGSGAPPLTAVPAAPDDTASSAAPRVPVALAAGEAPERERRIRSYVLRQGRITNAQQRAYEALLPQFGVPWGTQPLDAPAAFGRDAPLIVEIGFGMGEGTAQIAQAHPENNYLGIEVHNPGVGSLLDKIGRLALTNVRIIQHDAVEVVRDMIAPDQLAGVHVFFPDPWHKKRHHKRRLLQPQFVALLASRIAPGGYLHVATDWADYAQQVLAVLGAEPLLINTVDGYAPRPSYRPLTRFEQRGVRLGHEVFDLVFRRRAAGRE
jgi:tRNA (guanine-N7-)-methyltransferase